MNTSFEFEYQSHRVRAEYEQIRKLNGNYCKVFSFRVLQSGNWLYQGILSFPVKATKKQIIENAIPLFGPQGTSDE